MDNRVKGFLLVFLSAAGFGSMPVFARIAYNDGANKYELLAARFFIATLIMIVYTLWKKPPRRLTAKERSGAILMGLGGYSVASLCFFSAIQRIPTPLASILLYTYPAVVTCLASLFRIEKMDRKKAAALAVSFLGLLLALGSDFTRLDPLGVVLALSASLLYSMYIMTGNHTLRDAPLTAATLWISLAAMVGIGAAGLATGQFAFRFGIYGWLAVAGLALFSTVTAILSFLQGVVLVGASTASIISTLEPPITVILAAVFLAEVLGPVQLAGGALILTSAVLVNSGKNKQTEIVKEIKTA